MTKRKHGGAVGREIVANSPIHTGRAGRHQLGLASLRAQENAKRNVTLIADRNSTRSVPQIEAHSLRPHSTQTRRIESLLQAKNGLDNGVHFTHAGAD